MGVAEVWEFVLKALAVVGGIGVVAGAVSAFVAKFFADRSIERHKAELAQETETHKLSLRKKELLFGKQIDAASEFITLHQQLRPQYSHPDKDWDEACSEVVDEFSKVENKLNAYLAKYGAVLSAQRSGATSSGAQRQRRYISLPVLTRRMETIGKR
jgi:Flp pilus assembly protein CpaB